MAIKVSGTTVIDDSRNLTNVADLTTTGNTVIGGNMEATSYKGKLQALGNITGTLNIDLSQGDNVTGTVIGPVVINATGLKTGVVNTFTLILTNPGAFPLTLLAGLLTWDKNLTPSLPVLGKAVFIFESYDNGLTWIGTQAWRNIA